MSRLTGWSCIYCGVELSGPQEGQEHQESGECTGTPPSNEMVNIAYADDEAREIQARKTISPEEKAERLRKMPLRPGESQAMRDASVERLHRG